MGQNLNLLMSQMVKPDCAWRYIFLLITLVDDV